MFGILKSIFGSSEGQQKIIDAGIRGTDALIFTDEEKSDASKKFFQLYLEYQKSTQPQNMARRFLAFIVAGIWALLVLLIACFAVWGAFAAIPEPIAAAKALTKVMSDFVFIPFSGIMAFYFLTHTVRAKNGK